MPDSVTITSPTAGSTIGTGHTFTGDYTIANQPLDRIRVSIVFPATSANSPLLVQMNATPDPNPGVFTWTAIFGGLQQGLDATVTAELFVQGVLGRRDSDSVEDVDIANNPVGGIGGVTLVPRRN